MPKLDRFATTCQGSVLNWKQVKGCLSMLGFLKRRLRNRSVSPLKHTVVTTFHEKGYQVYGRKCLESFLLSWPEDVDMLVYAEDVDVDITSPRLTVLDHVPTLDKLRTFRAFYGDNPFANGTSPHNPERTGDFRWDAVRFCNKVFAITDAIRRTAGRSDQLIWLDADTVTHQTIPHAFIDRMAPRDNELAAYLNRKSYPECGWVGYNLNHAKIGLFADRFEDIFLDGSFLKLKESHDSFVFWHLVKEMKKQGEADFKYLGSDYAKGHIFINSELGQYLDHLKGDRKEAGKSYQKDLKKNRSENWWASSADAP
ncbi:hypothetical protein [Roseibium aggregatum]|uniref:hypothetical protein n=1 Tax=Roseibium aggregatum TaxID=187304 RepID=UPI003A97A95A